MTSDSVGSREDPLSPGLSSGLIPVPQQPAELCGDVLPDPSGDVLEDEQNGRGGVAGVVQTCFPDAGRAEEFFPFAVIGSRVGGLAVGLGEQPAGFLPQVASEHALGVLPGPVFLQQRHGGRRQTDRAPARPRLTLAGFAARNGELDQALTIAEEAFSIDRRSRPSLLMLGTEPDDVLRRYYPKESRATDFRATLVAATA